MSQFPKIKPTLFKGKTYSNGSHPIMIRITQNRKHTYKSIGHAVNEEAWNPDEGKVWEKKPVLTKRQERQLNSVKLQGLKKLYSKAVVLSNATHINTAIDDAVTEFYNLFQKMKVNEEDLTLEKIRVKLKPESERNNSDSFLEYATAKQIQIVRTGAIGTGRAFKAAIAKLKKFRNNKDLKFSEINQELLQNYEIYLIEQELKTNTIHANLKKIRSLYYKAIKEGIISSENNPFFVFKLKVDNKVRKEKLTVEEILAIENLKLKKGTLVWHVRNYFLFSFYCAGIRVSDLIQLKWENITSGSRVEYNMDKTGGYKSIALLPKAKDILKDYKKAKSKASDFIFPLINEEAEIKNPTTLHNQISAKTALINKYLKTIAKKAKIEKPLSTHIARHSFSDIARKRGANIYDISKMLGHSSIKITEAYLSSLDTESQDETHKNAMNF